MAAGARNAIAAIADAIVPASRTIDLTDPATIESILDSTASLSGAAVPAEALTAAATVIVDANFLVTDVTLSGDTGALEELARIEKAAVDAAGAISEAAAGNLSIDELLKNHSGIELQDTAANAPIGNIIPPFVGITNAIVPFSVAETTAVFDLVLTERSAAPITVTLTTEDETAIAGTDYDAFTGTVTFAPFQQFQQLEIPVHPDATRNGDQTFVLRITSSQAVPVVDSVRATIIGDKDGDGVPQFLDYARFENGVLTIDYSVTSDPARSLDDLRVEFFVADDRQQAGKTFLGFDTFTVADSAAGTKTITILAGSAVPGDFLVATAIDADGNASEFSAPILVFYDGNGDGVADSEQANVSSLPNAVNGSYVTVAVPAGNVLSSVDVTRNPSGTGNPPAEVQFPIGFVQFTMTTTSASSVAQMYLPEDVDVNTYYKFGGTPQNPAPHYYEFLFDGTTGAELIDIDGDGDTDKILLHFVDGGRGDADLTVNGVIVDPGAAAFSASRQLQPSQPDQQDVFSIFTPSSQRSVVNTIRTPQFFSALPQFPGIGAAEYTNSFSSLNRTRLDILNESFDDQRRPGLLEWYDEAATFLDDIGKSLKTSLLDESNPNDEGDSWDDARDRFWSELGRALLGTPGSLLHLDEFFNLNQSNSKPSAGENTDAVDTSKKTSTKTNADKQARRDQPQTRTSNSQSQSPRPTKAGTSGGEG